MTSPEPVRRYGSESGVKDMGRMARTALGWVIGGVGLGAVAEVVGGAGWLWICTVSSEEANKFSVNIFADNMYQYS